MSRPPIKVRRIVLPLLCLALLPVLITLAPHFMPDLPRRILIGLLIAAAVLVQFERPRRREQSGADVRG
ncbi:hypothetical protein [Niveibacterium sp. SC-1]|uniref:hypothetical protein n=1 Tax=Niveibacterium sp. SC-1 TaxID=3135646 RepID=UPI00311F6E92